jgi:hypothetical protein
VSEAHLEPTRPEKHLDLADVLRSAMELVRGRLAHFVRLAALASALHLSTPTLVFIAFLTTAGAPFEGKPEAVERVVWVTMLSAQVALPAVAVVAAAESVVASHRGTSLSVRAAITSSAARVPMFLLAALLVALLVWLGLVVVLVPGLIAMSAFALSGIVVVVERVGPMQAMTRSAALTAGVRGTVFLALAVVFGTAFVTHFLCYLVFACMLTAVLVSEALDTTRATLLLTLPYYVIACGISAAFALALQAVLGTIYARLEQVREKKDEWVETFG